MQAELIKAQLLRHLKGGEAFMPVEDLLDKVRYKRIGERPVGLPYSFYEVFYHMFYAQRDLLDFCTAESYKTPSWPKDYWSSEKTAETKEDWQALKQDFFKDRNALVAFIENPETDLLGIAKHGEKQQILRELMLAIEHNAYHLGQLVIIARLLGLH
ncbi:DinB family protein [Leeuwenhoekiella parthenopeia]|uniref:DinB family protein n=1 Tax=Leeuwenhoekiella parthenopeia TaxID=2890320 RepID=A0ABS8GY13_9FLAO|nr:DinB family protein [Leeuwenhoekiella parthenopeia]MCC4213991.1 DinB family protein [Leeuwenhoekiella parthenopeia]